MEYIDYAKKEFASIGYKPVEECEDGPDKWIQENVFELLEVLDKQGHSGTSIHFVVDYFSKLAKFNPLGPLTGEDSEWSQVDKVTWQNNRCSSIFKSSNGTAYNIDGYIFWSWAESDLQPEEDGYPGKYIFKSYFGSDASRKIITFPYVIEKPIPIEVDCFEVNEKTGEREPGSGWWETIYPEEILTEKAKLQELLLKK